MISYNSSYKPLALGQSGDQVFVAEEVGKYKVRKLFIANKSRGKVQFAKHLEAYLEHHMVPIRCPKPYSGLEDDWYAMEFLPGLTLGNFLEIGSQDQINNVSEKILSYLRNMIEPIENHDALKIELKKKVLSKNLTGDSVFDQLSQILLEEIETSNELLLFPTKWNHGDFSMENIIVDMETLEVSAFDFLDSQLHTKLLDWGRFWLDLNFGWWAYNQESRDMTMNKLSGFISSVEKSANEIGVSRRTLNFYAGLALLRIFPYTVESSRMNHLELTASKIAIELRN